MKLIRTQNHVLRKEAGISDLIGKIRNISNNAKKIFPKKLEETVVASETFRSASDGIAQELSSFISQNPNATPEQIQQQANALMVSQRNNLFLETQNAIIEAAAQSTEEAAGASNKGSLTRAMLRAFIKAVPGALVFGFIDNVIMVLVGDKLDAGIVSTLGWSTMAAAGLGNTISDVAGALAGDSIESALEKVGLQENDVDKKYKSSVWVHLAKLGGGAFGIAAGCLIGMFPLIFMGESKSFKKFAQYTA